MVLFEAKTKFMSLTFLFLSLFFLIFPLTATAEKTFVWASYSTLSGNWYNNLAIGIIEITDEAHSHGAIWPKDITFYEFSVPGIGTFRGGTATENDNSYISGGVGLPIAIYEGRLLYSAKLQLITTDTEDSKLLQLSLTFDDWELPPNPSNSLWDAMYRDDDTGMGAFTGLSIGKWVLVSSYADRCATKEVFRNSVYTETDGPEINAYFVPKFGCTLYEVAQAHGFPTESD